MDATSSVRLEGDWRDLPSGVLRRIALIVTGRMLHWPVVVSHVHQGEQAGQQVGIATPVYRRTSIGTPSAFGNPT